MAATTTKTARGYETTGDALLCKAGRILAGHLAGWRCPICSVRMHRGKGNAARLTIDHVIPFALGGGVVGNLVPLCKGCNSSKQDKPDLEAAIVDRLVAIGVYKMRGKVCRETAARKAAEILDLRDRLTAALKDAEIW